MVEECQLPQNRNIRSDQLIRLTGAQAQADYPDLLRRVVVWDADERARDRAADQSARVWRHHHRRHLQRPLGDRTVLQGAQAEPEGEELRGHQRERPAHPDLDSLDRPAAAEMAAPSVEGQLVAVQSGLDVAAEPVYLPRFAEVAGRSHRDTATGPRVGTTYPGAGMTWTGCST